jgi:hypothetical protein
MEENKTSLNSLELCAKLQKKKNSLRKELHEKGKLTNGEVNEFDNYQYFSEAQYKELFTDLFSKHGIELFVDEVDYGTFEGTDKQPYGRTVTLACTLIDIDTGFSETSKHTGEGLDRGDKAGYKATTGALKRFLSSTFLVATQDDPEREDEKPQKKTTAITKKSSQTLNNKKGTITQGQKNAIKIAFKDNIDELKVLLKNTYKVTKVDELSMESASQLIKNKKGGK